MEEVKIVEVPDMLPRTISLSPTEEKISDIYAWAKHIYSYEFTKNGIHVQGYMLVNDEGNRDEYEKILKSLKE
jgi:hypothetical protein